MYRILGGDRNEYGPASADDVRRWIAEGRLNGQSLARAEGGKEWQPLASFPEFMAALHAKAGLGPRPIGPLGPGVADAYVAETLARYPDVPIGYCLSRGWRLLKENTALLFGASAIYWGIDTLLSFVPVLGPLIDLLVHGILLGGLCVLFLKRIRGQSAAVRDVFSGFSGAAVQLLLAGLLCKVLGTLGFCCCIVPGVYLTVAWVFSLALVADKGLEFWSAMELSRTIVTRVWFQIFGLLLAAFLPLLVGYIVLGTVSAFTASSQSQGLTAILQKVFSGGQVDPRALAEAIKEIMKSQFTLTNILLGLGYKLVVLINMPFAVGALMYAYENLFGTRPAPPA
jgi:hypothetical protein